MPFVFPLVYTPLLRPFRCAAVNLVFSVLHSIRIYICVVHAIVFSSASWLSMFGGASDGRWISFAKGVGVFE